MRKRGLFGLVVTFIHDLIAPFDPEEDDLKFRYKTSQAKRHASPKSAEESQNWEPSELKHLLEPWDFLDEATWNKVYSGELPAEDYMSTVHVSPRPGNIYMGEMTQVFGAHSQYLPDVTNKEYPPEEFHTMAEPTPMSSEKIVIVSEDVVESVLISEEEHSGESDPVADGESPEATTDGNSEDSFESADNSSDQQGFDQLAMPADYGSNYGWANDNAFNDF